MSEESIGTVVSENTEQGAVYTYSPEEPQYVNTYGNDGKYTYYSSKMSQSQIEAFEEVANQPAHQLKMHCDPARFSASTAVETIAPTVEIPRQSAPGRSSGGQAR